MEKAGKIICYIFAGLIIVFSLIFMVFEGRTLFSGDWLIYENKVDGFIRYLFRLIVALFALAVGIFTYVALSKKEDETLNIYLNCSAIVLLVSSIIIAYFSSNYMDLLFIALASFYDVGILLRILGTRLSKK